MPLLPALRAFFTRLLTDADDALFPQHVFCLTCGALSLPNAICPVCLAVLDDLRLSGDALAPNAAAVWSYHGIARQLVLMLEIVVLFAVAFLPEELNLLANALVSFSCALQVQTFRKVEGNAYASTMCIGNLRSGTAALSAYMREKKPRLLHQALCYFAIILLFAIGAGVGGRLSIAYGPKAIWVSSILLLISFLLMFIEEMEEAEHRWQ